MSSLRFLFTASLVGALALACNAREPGRADASTPLSEDVFVTQESRGRRGHVHLVGRAFADDGGPWNALGASLFWALWGEQHDPDRLDANLAHLVAHGFDYIRILAMVGSASWADRVIDPRVPDYWATTARLFDRLERHHLRAQVVLFADAQVMMPDQGHRQQFARAWVDFINQRRDRVQLIEIANEHHQNGLDADEVRRLGHVVLGQTRVPVALSSPPLDTVQTFYAGWPSVATLHYDRDLATDHGVWGPVLQPWVWAAQRDGHVSGVVVNNEPIGPGSSVAADDDPIRLAAAFVTTFLAGNAAYVYHTGAGIRGGGESDRARGRAADIVAEPAAIVDGLAAWRARLPAGLANWNRLERGEAGFPFDGVGRAIDRGDLRAVPAAASGPHVVLQLIDQRAPIEVVARRAMHVRQLDPLTAAERVDVRLRGGESWTVPADAPTSVLFVQQE